MLVEIPKNLAACLGCAIPFRGTSQTPNFDRQFAKPVGRVAGLNTWGRLAGQ